MQIRRLSVSHFRGIASLEWNPSHTLCCLIGPGDSGKSTILDALEALLSSRWFSFSESDFFGCDTSRPIVIEATVGELSKALQSDDRFGLYIGGWTSNGELRDEPQDDDESALTVRLTVDATMEPVWEVVRETLEEPRTLSNRDRALFGLVRLAGEDARHLAWGQGSVLSRLTGETGEAAGRLAEAFKLVRTSANLHDIPALADAAAEAEGYAKGMGAYVEGLYLPGLELGRSGLSVGSIALHDGGVPLRLAGLGSRRLATLAIQKSAVTSGAIVLVDEIEHGLEPHRIIGAISQLKRDQARAAADAEPIGQIVMTTHSDVALGEVGARAIHVVKSARPGRATTVATPTSQDSIRSLLRHTPRALFAKRVLVCEGYTEVGLLLGIREEWAERHDGKPIEQRGAAIADGNGGQACQIALTLAELGYAVALYRDSDDALSDAQQAQLVAAGIPVMEYGGGLYTELALFSAASDRLVQHMLDFARRELGHDFIDNNLAAKIDGLDVAMIRRDFEEWDMFATANAAGLRVAIAEVAAQKGVERRNRKPWFKSQLMGRELAPLAWVVAEEDPMSPLAETMLAAELWLYD